MGWIFAKSTPRCFAAPHHRQPHVRILLRDAHLPRKDADHVYSDREADLPADNFWVAIERAPAKPIA